MNTEKVINEIAEFQPFESNLTEFKSQYIDIVYDLFDDEQEKKAKSDKLVIGKVISALDKKHKELKAPLKAKTDLIDHERKRIKDELLIMQGGIKHQLEQHEFKKVEHDANLHNMVMAISDLSIFQEFHKPDCEELESLLKQARSFNVDDSYEHRKADATLAQIDTIKRLELMLETAKQEQENALELKRLQEAEAKKLQIEREESIRKEAAENAKREAELKAENDRIKAEKAAQDKIEAAENAKKKAIDDANREKLDAENAKIQAEAETKRRETIAANKERERIQIEQQKINDNKLAEDKKEADKKSKQAHRGKIHKSAKESLIANGIDSNDATDLINLIKDGKIKNIIINY